ncbi:MAG TPA: P-loop NTPase, partial [Thermoleophilaceae bacterium]|nr:P-loop NTPase [Thermoleophilaceae bacterium]
GGGQLLADELDIPLLGKIPLTENVRRASDEGTPLVLRDPDDPASQAFFHAARGIVAATPQEIQVLAGAVPAGITGTPLPMAP